MSENSTFPSNPDTHHIYKTLLEISETISKNRDLHDLFRDLAKLVPQIVPVDFLGLMLYQPENQTIHDLIIQTDVPADIQGGNPWKLDLHPGGTVFQSQKPLLVSDITQDSRYLDVFSRMHEDGANSLCALPLTTAVRKLGALIFASCEKATYKESDFEFLEHVSRHVAVAVDNVLHVQELTKERDHSRLLLDVNNAVVSTLNLQELFASVSASLRNIIPKVTTSLYLYDSDTQTFKRPVLDFPERKGFVQAVDIIGKDESPATKAFHSRKALVWNESDMKQYDSDTARQMLAEGMKSGACAPLVVRNEVLGTLNVASAHDQGFGDELVALLSEVATQVAIGLDNALAYNKIHELKENLEQENVYLKDEIRTEHNFDEIIGESAELKRVLQQVEIVAPTDSTVLIQGETGTGKELIARALHHLSSRKERAFVKLNCAAIPTGLLESELFGHEKGAFTGAIAQKAGRFELANRGTIFLDEVGEIPLDLQSKLLRVLQEREFERLGSTRTMKVDVRFVAATNRDLVNMVEAGQFRGDLYYRLNVFPITLPGLRERPVDVPVLVRYFTQRFARRMNKPIETIPTKVMDTLSRYHWPGNIRELENLIERAVILSQGSVLMLPLTDLKAAPRLEPASPQSKSTLEGVERDHIVQVLRETKWVIGGPSGAAARLDLKRTTLISKMKKLKISRPL
ncbi:sigma 54-interacting transcriptional regulator [Nitrospira sp. T9]|uniref:sigma 54-interacting transcriptional regulator n=1 Tax=Nitrospira sp. T9 TaxID=3456077 RepID=UPI003F98049E